MADNVQPSGTSSTPAASGDSTPAVVASPSTDPAAKPSAEATPSEPAKAAEPAKAVEPEKKSAEPAKAEPAKEPAKSEPAKETQLFKLPDDLKVDEGMQAKFTEFVKGKVADGKLTLTPQEVVDLFADQARASRDRWVASVGEQDKAWAAASKTRFSAAQLAAAETGVGFIASFDPEFRELVKGIANHPTFVNAMRIVGERLSEDTFELEGARPTAGTRQAKDILYPKRDH